MNNELTRKQKIEKEFRRMQLKESIKSQCLRSIEEKIDRYLGIEHQGVIGGHYFSEASSECIYLYRDGYFIGAVMMSHAINEGIGKFIAERNGIQKGKHTELINEFLKKGIISRGCAEASSRIWKSYRNDIHHMNPKVAKISFEKLAQQNLKDLAIIEKEIFGCDFNNGAMVPRHPKYWDINQDKTTKVFLRLE